MSSFRYALTWKTDVREWRHQMTFPDVASAKLHARLFAPDNATNFEIKRVDGDHVVTGELSK